MNERTDSDGSAAAVAVVCAAGDPGDSDGTRMKAAASAVVDWDEVVDLALAQRMPALLHVRLGTWCPELVDAAALERLRELHDASQRLATRAVANLLRILALLEDNGVRAMPVKGPAQSLQVYGDLGLRQFADLDIAVAAGDLASARRVLLEQGFAMVQPASAVDDSALLHNEGEIVLRKESIELLVELHWRVGWRLAPVSIPAEALLDEAGSVDLLGRPTLAPSARDLVLILCVHAADHAWERLEMMVAVVAAATRISAAEWEGLFARAERFNNLRRTIVGLVLSHETLAVSLPLEVRLRAAADPAVRKLVAEVRTVWRDGVPAPGAGERLRRIVWLARTEDSTGAACARLAARVLTPGPEDWDSARLPPRLAGLYYLWRPLRLAGKFARLRRRA